MLHYLLATSFGTCDCTHVYTCIYVSCAYCDYEYMMAGVHYCGALGSALEVSLHVAMSCHNSDPLTCT